MSLNSSNGPTGNFIENSTHVFVHEMKWNLQVHPLHLEEQLYCNLFIEHLLACESCFSYCSPQFIYFLIMISVWEHKTTYLPRILLLP